MTTFYADVRIYHSRTDEPTTISIELPAPDMAQALQVVGAFKAGLSANPKFDRGTEESITEKPRRGTKYITLREAAQVLKNTF